MQATRFFIGGEWCDPLGGEVALVTDPASGDVIGHAAMGGAGDIDLAVAAAEAAFPAWSASTLAERIALLERMRAAFAQIAPALAQHLVREIGLTPMVAGGQGAMCLAHFDSVLDLLPAYQWSVTGEGDPAVELVREPIGVVGAITSWNAPVSQILCKAVPAIAAGCTVVVKPSEQAPLCAHLLAEAMAGAGIPPGVLNIVNGRGGDAGLRLAQHPGVAMVSMTGSVAGGAAMAAAAAPTIKRVHQELGGKSANIVLPDADLAEVIPKSVIGCMMNAGQVCAAPTRLLVHRDQYAEAGRLAVAAAEALVVGPPDAPGTSFGPLANAAQFERVQALLGRAQAEGEPLLTGGPGRPPHLSTGFYARPTVFGPVAPGSFLAQEELFGPILAILTYGDEDEAVAIANHSAFGLAAYVQSADRAAARRVAGRLRAGYVTLNFPGWTAAAPFGGYKASGNGKQYGVWGFEEFLELKAIVG